MRIRTPGFQLLLASCLLVTVNGSLPKVVHAETRTATGLTPEAVWEAIDAAKDGDTVQLPAGRAVWTCGWNTGHWAKMKAITIRGREWTRRSFAIIGATKKAAPYLSIWSG